MKKLSLLFFSILFIVSCGDQAIEKSETENKELLSLDEMKSEVESYLQKGEVYRWENASDLMLWSAGAHSDQFFSIGYTTDQNFDFEKNIHHIDITANEWISARQEVLNTIIDFESKALGKTLESKDLLPFGDEEFFPHLIVKLGSEEMVSILRNHENVRFVEPIGFSFEDAFASARSNSGCDASPDYNLPSDEFTTISPGTKQPWNFGHHDIQDAWSSSTGDNIRLAIIDTGASDNQNNLGSQFTSGWSSGRSIQKLSTHVSGSWWWASLDSPNDQCGHGTSMAGIAAGPRGTDGNAVGVAYKADLTTIRAVEDVVITTSAERVGVRNALYIVGNTSSIKLASMSIGTPFYSSTVADGVIYAYNRGKMIISAAGTSLTWTSWYPVIFPATMTQTVAVTGLRDNGTQRCATCHAGSQVDFTIIMERASNNSRTTLSLASSSDQPKYTGGSSSATATVAGIATLVWSANPNANRATILQKLQDASQFYPSRHGSFGWGQINANDAVGGS